MSMPGNEGHEGHEGHEGAESHEGNEGDEGLACEAICPDIILSSLQWCFVMKFHFDLIFMNFHVDLIF